TLSKFMSESAKRHEENSNLIKEIRASTDAAIRNQGASIKTLEIQIGKVSKERGFGSLPSSIEANLRDQVKSILTTIKANSYPIRHIRSSQYAVSTGQNCTLMYETRQMTIPFLSRLNGYYCDEKKGYLNLRLGELAHTKLTVELADMIMKYPKGIAKNVLVCIDKMVYKGNNVIEALMNVPIFVETFFVVTDFTVLENMDAYHDEGIGDVIFGEPFLREIGIKARRFERMITIYNGNESVTYQMVRSHPRFEHHTNEQCNKIPPLLKVIDEDKNNGISHPYQKLKGFYKGVLNFGPDFIRDAKTEEWLTRGHISVHEMK
ncbi:hypothetical protein Tco_0714986, partial [Tanacetum coccineum]